MNSQTITYQVSGMHCASCPRLIQMDLEDKPGVITADASLDTKLVVVEYDSEVLTSSDIIATIKQSGYDAVEVK